MRVDTASSKTKVRPVKKQVRSLDDSYRHRKRLFVLPGEGTFSGVPYGSRSDVFNKEQSIATSAGVDVRMFKGNIQECA